MKQNLPKLSKPTAYGYRCSKGFVVNDAGQTVQKFFWLGPDPTKATLKRAVLDEVAAAVHPCNGERLIWTSELLSKLNERFDQIDGTRQTMPVVPSAVTLAETSVFGPGSPPLPPLRIYTPPPAPAPVLGPALNLHEALDQFSAHVRSLNEKSLTTRDRACHHVTCLKYHLPNLSLQGMNYDQLQKLRSIITARPNIRRQKDAKRPLEPKPISIITARNWLATLGQAFKWFRKTQRWIKPLELELDDVQSVFGLNKSEQKRLARNRQEAEHLTTPSVTPTIEELAIYYKMSVPGQRLFMLMGICLGWRQTQIADLRKNEIVRRGGEYYIRFARTKTGVKGDLWLCPELADLLIARVQQTPENSENYAFLTAKGQPLVHRSKRGNTTDSITLMWDRIRDRAVLNGAPSFPFSSLRRFAGQVVANLGDPFLAQVLLAQGVNSVLEVHYAGRGVGVGIGQTAFQKVHEVQRKVWASLKPLFDAATTDTGSLKKKLQESRLRLSEQIDAA